MQKPLAIITGDLYRLYSKIGKYINEYSEKLYKFLIRFKFANLKQADLNKKHIVQSTDDIYVSDSPWLMPKNKINRTSYKVFDMASDSEVNVTKTINENNMTIYVEY